MNPSFDLEEPDHFTAGAVGEPGHRTFFLQGREGALVVTLKAEKEHVSALAEYLASLLVKLPASGTVPGDLDLLEPAEPVWAIGSIGVGYEEARDRIVVVAREAVEGAPDEEEEDVEEEEAGATPAAAGPDEEPDPNVAQARFRLTREQAAAFVQRSRAIVRAGRPTCPLCSQPMDPAGHVCPRSNGHVVGRPE